MGRQYAFGLPALRASTDTVIEIIAIAIVPVLAQAVLQFLSEPFPIILDHAALFLPIDQRPSTALGFT